MSRKPHPNLGIIIFLIGLILATRLPFTAKYLTKWDSCNFAFALENFNIADHAPHPPGYPFYIGAGALVNSIIRDANLSFIIIGIILCCVTAVFVYLTGRLLFGHRIGWLASILFALSPVSVYLSSTALSYMSDAALISAILYMALLAHNKRCLSWPAYVIPIILGIGAGFRIPGFILCLPIYFIHLLDLNWRKRIVSVVIIAIIIAAGYGWVIRETGGWAEYISVVTSESVKHEKVFEKLIDHPGRELAKNISRIIMFTRQSLGPLWFLLFLPFLFPKALFTGFTREKLLIWAAVVPAILLFTFVYINYTAIMFILLPTFVIAAVYGMSKFSRWLIDAIRGKTRPGNVGYAVGLLTLIWLVSTSLAAYQTHASSGDDLSYEPGTGSEIHEYSYNRIKGIDFYIDYLIKTAKFFPPDETCFLMFMETKHIGYYLRDYHVIWDKYLIRFPSKSSTGIYSLFGGKREMLDVSCQEFESSFILEMPLPDGCHILIFRDDILPAYIPPPGLESTRLDGSYSLYAVRDIPEGFGIIVERYLSLPGAPSPPPPSWSIGPIGKHE